MFPLFYSYENIRIYYKCEHGESGIEKSVQVITDRHQEACRVMTNGDHEGRIFYKPSSHELWIIFLAHH